MSEKFNGFSQDEINRVSGTKHKKTTTTMETMKSNTFRGHGGIRRMPDKAENLRQQKMPQKKTSASASANPNVGNVGNVKFEEKLNVIEAHDSMEDINLDSSLSKSIEEALFYQPLKTNAQPTATATATSTATATTSALTAQRRQHNQQQQQTVMDSASHGVSNDSSILKLSLEMDSQISSSSTCSTSMDDSSIIPTTAATNEEHARSPFVAPASLNVESPFKGVSLKDFESHRKMIEEQNRQKKDMLYKVIEQHSQKTAAETRKIEEIKGELAKLDNDLAVDVALLRKQIDNACIHFAAVEKHYMKIESQFLKAKMDFHNAAEKKELLTEHLCTVIAHNEDRKAQKLTELMEKVGLAACADYEPPTSTSN